MQINITSIFLVGLGGAIGSISRYLFYFIGKNTILNLPIATLGVNLIGSFIIGCLLPRMISSHFEHSNWTIFFMIGLLGGFTTFSSFSVENIRLILEGKILTSILYIFLSVGLSLAMTYLGYLLFKS